MNKKNKNEEFRLKAEKEYFKRLLEIYPRGYFSYVADTYNLWEVIRDILPTLKDKIMNRDGRVVIRPDSGDPCDILCGLNTKTYYDDLANKEKSCKLTEGDYAEQINKGVIELLWDIFGGTINSKGYKVLDTHIGCIYGDAITLERAEEICKRLESKGFASSNVVFGIGSYCVTKDTKILCSDLIWRKAGEIEVGQEIICFDENPIYGNGAMSSRRYKLGKITANEKARKKCVEICCGDKKLKCSLDHPILVWDSMSKREDFFIKPSDSKLSDFDVQLPRGKGLIWRKARDISIGDKVAYMCPTWDSSENDFNIGWLSGMYDGEGTLCRWKDNKKLFSCCKISLSQNEGLVLDKVREILKKYNFTFYESITKSGCVRNTITGGFLEYLRFLGTFQPIRLMNVAKNFIKNLPVLKRNTTYSLQEVTNINNIDIQDIASITTSEGTFITDGFLTHNTYNMNTRDTFGFALKTTYAVVNGKELLLYKDPYTDDGTKKSQKGLVVVYKDENGEIQYKDELNREQKNSENYHDLLQPVFVDGKLLRETSLSEIRERVKNNATDTNS